MRQPRGDSGQAGVQYMGLLPLFLIVTLLCLKVYIMINAVEQIDNAARAGAREASISHVPGQCPTTATEALPNWLKQRGRDYDGGQQAHVAVSRSLSGMVSCHVQAKVPILWRGVPFDITVNRTVHMPG